MPEVIDVLRLSRTGRFDPRGLEFTAIDFETSALAPGHIVELAAVRTTADGIVLGELSTVVNPGPGISPGPVHVHGITRGELDFAPTLPEAFAYLSDFLRDSVLVAHNLDFEARFLRRELDRYGIGLAGLPGLCTLTTAKDTLRLPNYRLATVARSLGLADFPAHTALGDARACAQVVTTLMSAHGLRLTDQPRFAMVPQFAKSRPLAPRRATLPARVPAWTAELPERIPAAAASSLEEAYLDLLGNALADRHISADEAAALTQLAAAAGLAGEDLRRVHTGFVEGMRTIAESDGILTAEEVADLKTVAAALDVPGLVAGLRPTKHAGGPTRVLVLGGEADADVFRAAVLSNGLQLAQRLTASVTHLVACPDVADSEPRLGRAAELGIPVLDVDTARTHLLPAPEQQSAPAAPPTPEIHTPRQPPAFTPATQQWAPPQPTMAFAPAVPPQTPPQPPAQAGARTHLARLGGLAITALGLILAFAAAVAGFGGSAFGTDLVLFLVGAGIALGGWYLGERWARVRSW
ncbi:exonuclease domain-containing protein [Amycolatopsis sp. GM8]|uniref:exonuclease domain-containing protein n=1 Tax=Amycolatopsis sp. GM8 TaxID=2896530 RepID=UPI001F19433F|nr:exonuclease domain-containing protein [Amycolatopsis sp. GM8]